MAKIDELVLTMKFDNSKFKTAVQDTLTTLDRLKSSMKIGDFKNAFKSSAKDAVDFGNAVNNIDLSHISGQVAGVQKQFGIMGTIGRSALGKLTFDAIDTGKRIASAISAPLIQGGLNRAKNIEQARFMLKGLGADVEAMETAAMNAVDGTAYGFDQAARAASQFYASGVKDSGAMEKALLGISGAASMTGASYDDIANIFTTVAGNGRLMSEQLNQFAYRGLNVAATLAERMNMTEGEFRDAVSKGKVTFEDFYTHMSEAYGEHAKKAGETFSGALANAKAPLARIGADVASVYLEQMTKLFNAIRPFLNVVHGALSPVIDLINQMQAKTIGGLATFINSLTEGLSKGGDLGWIGDIGQGIANIMSQLNLLRGAIGRAFSRQFLELAGSARSVIERLARSFLLLTEKIRFSERFLDSVSGIFGAIFAAVDFGLSVFKSFAKSLVIVGGAIGKEIVPHLAKFAEYIANVISWILRWVKGASLVEGAFNGVTAVLVGLIKVIGKVLGAITKVTDALFGFVYRGLKSVLKGTIFDPSVYPEKQAKAFVGSIKNIASALKNIPTKGLELVANVFGLIKTVAQEAFQTITAFVKSIDFSGLKKSFDWVKNLKIFDKIKNPFEKFSNMSIDFSGATKSVQSFGEKLRSGIGPKAGVGTKVFEPIKKGFSSALQFIRDVDWGGVFRSIGSGISTGASYVGNAFAKLFNNTKDFLGQVDWKALGSTIVEKIASGLSKTAEVTSNIAKSLKEAVEGAVKKIDFGKIWDNIKDFGKGVGEAVEESVSGAKESIEDLGNQEITVKTSGIDTESISKGSKSIIDRIKDIGSELRDAFSGVKKGDLSAIRETFGDAFGAIIGGIASSFKNIVGAIKQGFQWISDPIGTGAEKLTSGFKSAFDKFTNTASDTVVGSLETVQDKASKINWGGILKGLTSIANAASFFMLAKSIKDMADSFSMIPTSIAGFFDGLTESISGFAQAAKIEAQGNFILKLAGALAIMAGSLWLISKIPADDIKKSLYTMGAILLGLGLFTWGMSKLEVDKSIPMLLVGIGLGMFVMAAAIERMAQIDLGTLASGVGKMGLALAGLGLAIAIGFPKKLMFGTALGLSILLGSLWMLYFAIKMFAKLDWETAGEGVGLMALSILAIGGALRLAQGAKPLQGAVSLMILAGSLLMFHYAISKFQEIDGEAMAWGLTKVFISLGILVGALIVMNKWGGQVLGAATSLAILAGSLMIMAFALRMLNEVEIDWVKLAGLGAVLAGLVVATNMLNGDNGIENAAKNLMFIAGAILIMTVAIGILGSMDQETVIQGTAALAVSLLALGGAVALMGKFGAEKVGLQMIGLAVGIMAIAGAIYVMGQMSWDQVIRGVVGLALGLGVLLVAAFFAEKVAVGLGVLTGAVLGLSFAALMIGGALLLGAFAFKTFVDAVMQLVDNSEQLREFAGTMKELAGPMAMLAGSLFLAGIGLGVFALGLGGLSIVSTIGGFGLKIFVGLMERFADAVKTLSDAFVAFNNGGADGLKKMAELGGQLDGLGGFLGKMRELKGVIDKKFANAFKNFADGMSTFKETASGLSEAFTTMANLDLSSITNMQEQLGTAFSHDLGSEFQNAAQSVREGINSIVDAIRNADGKFSDAGKHLGGKLASGIKDKKKAAENAGKDLGKAGAGGAKNARSEFVSAGKHIAEGLAEGIRQAKSSAIAAAEEMAREASDAAKRNLKVKSPSRVFMEIGNFVGLGFANGIESSAPKSAKASTRMAGKVIGAAASTLDIHSPSKVFHGMGENVNQGFADGIDAKSDRPADAMGETADGVIGAVESRTDRMSNATDNFFDAFFGGFNDNGLTQRLKMLVNHAKALHATSIKEQKIKKAEEREKKEDEREQIYRDVEDARRELEEAGGTASDTRESASEVKRDARAANTEAKRTAAETKKIDRQNADAAQSADKSKRDYDESQQKLRDAEKKYRRAMSKKERYEYEQYGTEAGVAFIDGVAVGLIDESDKLPTLNETLTDVLYEELDKTKKEADAFVGVFDGLQSIGKNFRKLGDSSNELRRAFTRMSRSTNPRTFLRNMGATFDATLDVGKGLVEFMAIGEKFKPFLPTLFNMFDSQLGNIIPMVAQFSPQLASTLGGGLAAALPAIVGPATAIIGAVAGIGYAIYDSGGEQRIIEFLRSIVEGVKTFFKNLPELTKNFAEQMLNGIVNLFTEVPKLAGELVVGFINGITSVIKSLPKQLPEFIKAFVNALVTIVTEAPTLLIDIALAIIDALIEMIFVAIPELIVKLPEMFLEVGKAIVQGIIKGMLSIPRAIVNGVRRIGESIKGWFKRIFRIKSPSRVMAEMGQYLTEGLAMGMEEGRSVSDEAAKSVAKSVVDTAKRVMEEDFVNELDLTITPVLDMSMAEDEWARFNTERTLNAAQTYGEASNVGPIRTSAEDLVVPNNSTVINYTQNNTSPNPLSTIDIYRNTQRQLENMR